MKIFKKSDDSFVGTIMGVNGVYADAIFRIDPNERITIGRDPKSAQIVVDENCELVSRKHCTILGCVSSNCYIVTDYSTNGTFADGKKLPKGEAVAVARGTVIAVGDESNTFRLN